jgi:glycosidase
LPWSPGPGAGFTTGRPWLRLGPDAQTRNVQAQAADRDSVLSLYRRLIELRASTPALQTGSLELVTDHGGSIVAYTRTGGDRSILVAINIGRTRAGWTLPGDPATTHWRSLLRTSPGGLTGGEHAAGDTLEMDGDEAVILERIA